VNAVAVVVLVTLVGSYALDLLAGILNVRNIQEELPDGFEDVYDPERYRRSQSYLKANTRLGWVTDTVHLAALLAFWFGGGFAWLDAWVRSFGWGSIATGVAFVAALAILRLLLGLPFSLYAVFVIEERFGFNRTDVKTFVMDRAKGLLLGAGIGGPLLAVSSPFSNTPGATPGGTAGRPSRSSPWASNTSRRPTSCPSSTDSNPWKRAS
jgi:STE24 endopeptidase